MAYTFDEVLQAFDSAKQRQPQRWAGADVYGFARAASQVDPNFQPVAESNWVQRVSRSIDEELAATGLPQQSADFFGQLAALVGQEQAGREAGRMLPRQALNVLPMAASGGLGGILGSAALTASDIYAQTNSPLAAAVGTIATPLTFGFMKPAGQAALGGLAKAGANVGISEAGQYVPTSIAQRIAEFTGRQAGGYVGGEVVGEATSLAAGQGLYDPTSPEAIIGNLVGTIPFSGVDAHQYMKEKLPEIARRSNDVQVEVQTPAADVPEFTPSNTVKGDILSKQLIAQQSRLNEISKLTPTPELKAEHAQILKNITQLAYQRQPLPTATREEGIFDPPAADPAQLELFDSETIKRVQDFNVSRNKNNVASLIDTVRTSNEVLHDVTEQSVSDSIESGVATGTSPAQTVGRTVQAVANRAKDKAEVRERVSGAVKRGLESRERRQVEFNEAFAGLNPELQKTIGDELAAVQGKVDTTRVDPATADAKFQGVVMKWLTSAKDSPVEELRNGLNKALDLANKPVPKVTKIQQQDDKFGGAGKPKVYGSKLDAKIAADDLNKSKTQENVQYVPKAAGKGYAKGSYFVGEQMWEGKASLVENQEGKAILTQGDFDADNGVAQLMETVELPTEDDAPNQILVKAIKTRIDDGVRTVEDLSDKEIRELGIVDVDPPTWRRAFGFVEKAMTKGKLEVDTLQELFNENGIEKDAMDFLMEPATVEMFGHVVKKMWGEEQGELVRGDDGGVYLASDMTRPVTKVPPFKVQVKNLLSTWFEQAGYRPEEVQNLTNFGTYLASLTDHFDDINLGVVRDIGDTARGIQGLSSTENPNIWLAQTTDRPELLMSVLAHELGHQINNDHFQMKVPVEWAQRYDNAVRYFTELVPEDRAKVLDILVEALPKEFRGHDGLEDLLARAVEDPNEMVAQVTGMTMLGATGQGTMWRKALEMLPKPVADWIFHTLDVAKATLDAVSAAAWYGQSPIGEFKRSKEFRKGLTEFRRTMDQLWKAQQDIDRDVTTLMGLDTLTPDGLTHLQQTIANPMEINSVDDSVYKPAIATASSFAFNRFSQGVEDWYVDKKYLAAGTLKNFFQNFTPVRTLKELYPQARVLFGIPLVQQRRREQVAEQVFTHFNLKWNERGESTIDSKGSVLNKVLGSERLQKVISDIRRDMNLKGTKYADADLQRSLSSLSAKDREDVFSYVRSMTLAEESMRGTKRESRIANVQKAAATIVLKRSPSVGAEHALQASKHLWDAIESGDTTAMGVASTVLGSNTFLDLYKFYQNLKNNLKTFEGIETANPFYTTERRMGRYFINYVKMDGTTDTVAFDNAGAWERKRDEMNADLNIAKVEAVDSDELDTRHGIKQELLDAADKYDEQVVGNIRALLPDDEFDKIRPYLSVKNELLKEFAQTSSALMAGLPGDVTKELKRKFKAEREGLNLVQGQLRNLSARVNELARSDARSDLMLNMADPKQTYDRRPDLVNLVHKNYENYQMPDTQVGSLTNLGAFTYFLGGNLSNMAMEGAQWLVTLPSVLTEIGAANNAGRGIGLIESWSRTLAAADDVASWFQKGRKWEDTEVSDLMDQASYEIDRTTGTMEEVISKESMALINSARMGKGLAPVEVGSLLKNPLTHYMNLMRWMYQIPSGLNNRIALVAGYRLARDRGLSHQAAIDDAKRVSYLANFNEGKAGRPIAPFSNKGQIGRTAAQMVFSLQAYNLGMVSTFGRMAYNAFSKRTELPLSQRRQARRALVQLGATQFAIAGSLGMPFAGAGLAVLNQLLGLNAEEDLRETIALLGGHDRELGGMVSRFAMDGVLNQTLPIDIASRYGIGNIAGLSSYDGWSMDNLFGPVGSMLAQGWKGASNLVQGNMGQAFEDVVPIGFKNVTKLYRDDWKVMDSEGNLLLEPTQTETFMKAIGFAPARLGRAYKAQRLQKRARDIESREKRAFRTDIADLYDSGDIGQARNKMLEKQLADPTFDPNYEVRQISQQLIGRRFQSSDIDQATGELLGVPPGEATAMDRLNQMEQVKQALGFGRPATKKTRQRALIQDVMTQQGMYQDEASQVLDMF